MRLRGLAGRAPDGTTLVLPRCRDVHTLTMRHALDIAFLDKSGIVLEVHRMVSPGARLRRPRAATVVERFAGPGPWLMRGDVCLFGSVNQRKARLGRRRAHESVSRVRQHAVR